MSDVEKSRRSGISSWAIRRPIGTVMLTSVILVLGLFFLARLPLDLLPSIVYPNVRASVTNSGVAPEVMEETVAKPLEAALATTENLIRMETEVQEGRVGVNLHFAYGTNIDFALQDAAKNLERARSRLPQEVDPPTINKFDPTALPIYEVGFSSPSRDLISLRDWVENRLQPQLLTIDGVASIDISGGLQREIQVVLDQERIRSYGLTVSQVIEAIRSANQDVAAGRVGSSEREIVGRTAGKFQTVEDIQGLLLTIGGGGRVPLSEVAQVTDTNREQRLWSRLDGVPAVRLAVRKQPDANTVQVAEAVDARIAELSASNFVPPDIVHATLLNQAGFIRNSVNSVRDAALVGGALAMLVVLCFLGSFRKTFVIGLAIPIAVLFTFLLMGAGNLTLNIMSLGGLALGVGLLIDSSIVMLENVFRHAEEKGENPEEAAHEGAAEVKSALIASTATNLAAVLPFLLISGLAALIFRELILTISFAIVGAMFVALTVVPMLAAQLAKVRFSSGIGKTLFFRRFDAGMEWLRAGYRRIGHPMLRLRWAVLGIAVLALVGSAALIRNLGSQFLPSVDDGTISVNMMMPAGTPPEQTNRVALGIEAIVNEMPHVRHVYTTAGGMSFGANTSENAGRGSLGVQLAPLSERSMSAEAWIAELQQRVNATGFPGARIFVRPPSIRGLRTSTSGSAISLMVQGDELDELQRIAEEILARVEGVPGLQNMEPSTDEPTEQLSIEMDRERAGYLGLNVATVGQTLRTALDGTVASRFTDGNQEYDIRVMFPRDRFQDPDDIGTVALFPGIAGGAPIYLRDVAGVYTRAGPTAIRRENQSRLIRINGDVATDVASVGAVNDSIRVRLAGMPLPDGYGIIIGGEEEAIRENNRQLAIAVLLAVFLVFVVLAVQYESMINPLVILFSIPLSLVGVGFGVWVTNTPLSAPVLLGVILLTGIVVNNAILLVEYIEQFRKTGAAMWDAVVEAGVVRLRPILMTTITTVLGMSPLALGIGEGSEMMQPLAIAVVGGLLSSTVLTLFVVPSAYVILNTGADRLKTWLTGDGPPHPVPPPTEVQVPERVAARVGAGDLVTGD